MTATTRAARPAPSRLPLLARAVLAALCALPVLANAAPAPAPAAAPTAARGTELAALMTLSEGKSTLMHLPYPVARLAVGDAKVADVILLNPSEVYLLGKSTGSTNLILWNKANQATIIDIVVGLDSTALRQQFDQLFPTEKDIRITVSGGALILSGVVSDSVKAAQIVSVAGAYLQRNSRSGAGAAPAAGPAAGGADPASLLSAATPATSAAAPNSPAGAGGRVINMLAVAAPQQVMLEVRIAEISKTLVDQLGASVGLVGHSGSWTYTLLSNLLTGNPGKLDAFNGKNGKFLTFDAQKNDGLVKILAEPTVMAISGQEASFLAGGKIFIPVSQNSGTGVPTITLEEKEYGVAVKFTPTVLEGGRINLKVSPEVSELNREGVGITSGNSAATSVLPSFTTRRASTTVQLYDGQSFAIGGLIKNNVTTNIKAFPGLGEIPVLGALFRSSDFQSDRTELVFIVTPHLAKPLPPNPKLPTDAYSEPSRADFFLRGKLEGGAPPASPAQPAPPAAGFDVK
ncbi:pilus assembly protein CpaC [Duganella sp. CF517]|uniref:type II and III secretion system protein family protein n=1 Tax=Duganella sp. CF517 TaxID=1881038 RepID=UPI0008B04E1C|nr:type II and III secretion system protein family protein [Duganella sp. CF517]SEO20635.1 pilus assembly protein CpaC [Duganella sp. CF517]